MEIEVQKYNQISRDLEVKIGIIRYKIILYIFRDEQIDTHKIYSLDMDKHHHK